MAGEKDDDFQEELEVETEVVETEEPEGDAEQERPEVETEEPEKPKAKAKSPDQKIQERIDRITKARRQAERERDEYARKLQDYESRGRQTEQIAATHYEENLSSRLATAKAELRKAIEEGDADAAVEANGKLAVLSVENEAWKQGKARLKPQEEPQRDPPPRQPVPASQDLQPSNDKAAAWVSRRPWVTTDPKVAPVVEQIDTELSYAGYDPDDDEYYEEFDRRLAARFPERFEGGGKTASRGSPITVAPAGNPGNGGARRSARLSSWQRGFIERAGITPEEYLREKNALRQPT